MPGDKRTAESCAQRETGSFNWKRKIKGRWGQVLGESPGFTLESGVCASAGRILCCGLTVMCREGRRDPQGPRSSAPLSRTGCLRSLGTLPGHRGAPSAGTRQRLKPGAAARLHFPRLLGPGATASSRPARALSGAGPLRSSGVRSWPCSTRPARSGFLALRLWLLPVLSRSPGGLTRPPAAGCPPPAPFKVSVPCETRVPGPEGALSEELQGGPRGLSQPPQPFIQKLPPSVSFRRREGGCT